MVFVNVKIYRCCLSTISIFYAELCLHLSFTFVSIPPDFWWSVSGSREKVNVSYTVEVYYLVVLYVSDRIKIPSGPLFIHLSRKYMRLGVSISVRHFNQFDPRLVIKYIKIWFIRSIMSQEGFLKVKNLSYYI